MDRVSRVVELLKEREELVLSIVREMIEKYGTLVQDKELMDKYKPLFEKNSEEIVNVIKSEDNFYVPFNEIDKLKEVFGFIFRIVGGNSKYYRVYFHTDKINLFNKDVIYDILEHIIREERRDFIVYELVGKDRKDFEKMRQRKLETFERIVRKLGETYDELYKVTLERLIEKRGTSNDRKLKKRQEELMKKLWIHYNEEILKYVDASNKYMDVYDVDLLFLILKHLHKVIEDVDCFKFCTIHFKFPFPPETTRMLLSKIKGEARKKLDKILS